MKLKHLLLLSILLFSIHSTAEVMTKSAYGFHLKIEREVAVNTQSAYQQFINIGQWWSSDHTWFGDAANLYIEPKAGACFCEVDGDKSVLHMTVSHVVPNQKITLLGGLGPLQDMGLHGALTFKFKALSENTTLITQEYKVSGYTDGGLAQLAEIVNKVQTLQMDGLIFALGQK